MNKKITSILLVTSMAFSMTACGSDSQDESSKKTTAATTTAATTAETTGSETEPEAESVSADTESLMGFNMIENPDFSGEDFKWGTYFEGGAGELKVNSDGEMQFDVKHSEARNIPIRSSTTALNSLKVPNTECSLISVHLKREKYVTAFRSTAVTTMHITKNIFPLRRSPFTSIPLSR